MEKNSCCFIGHRTVEDKEVVFAKAKAVIETLVKEKGVRIFHFGSRSEFDEGCHQIVTALQAEYPDIKRVNYHCKSEAPVKKEEKAFLEQALERATKRKIALRDFERAKTSERIANAGKASYAERNEEMIDDSDYCVFYYLEEYRPQGVERCVSSGKSGTKLAYEYATSKKKTIFEIVEGEE